LKTTANVPRLEIRINQASPLQMQLRARLRDLLIAARLPQGTRLPSSRALARQLAVSRNTVLFAYEELAALDLLKGTTGSGTRVARAMRSVGIHDPDGLTVHCLGFDR